ncbi:hypothetical protein P168DRAFT_281119 [Aspergillus campestris IBT 28561]|uniref:Uncharacterized protein n=1 Tax=Aspergillus campestris (strain IBT 28561) TaxID=1392248 RepID=A0A2I1D4D8_ASPC2|nr:uncharacterized protein P168DRAFT_281119 [Aspergillus campestris IBT 28561]PKY04742.1 hypothetical protein P168DRAFT_281119 [Aspergillus campestris IBT 28561]
MPVKWTPEKDQLLLLKILETHELSVDTKKVADAWPGESRPTPRAITERLVRMRQMVKQSSKEGSEGHFSIGKGGSSNPSTPRKPRRGPGSATATPSSGKRKRVANGAAMSSPIKQELDDGMSVGSVPVKVEQDSSLSGPSFGAVPYANGRDETGAIGSTIGLETQVGSGVDRDGVDYDLIMRERDVSPTKRPRRAAVSAPGMMRYMLDGDDDEVDVESSASEYVPEQRALFGVQHVDQDMGFA